MDELNESTIRQWAYDPDAQLDQQDEDLVLQQPQYVAFLLTIAEDACCPKRVYILSILDHYMMNLVLRGSNADLQIVNDAIASAEQSNAQDLGEWVEAQRRRLAHRHGVGALDEQGALAAAEELLNGLCRRAPIKLSGETNDVWQFDLDGSGGRAVERLLIDKSTGRFRFLENHGNGWLQYGPRNTA